jgi:FKBP-type peptidyl-prolyl cis-trans isomerase FklB
MPTTREGFAWLHANAEKPGVVALPSGLQYKVVSSAPDGAKSPLETTPCDCHYRGSLIDGTEFDSSHKRGKPSKFAPNKVIRGWREALMLMGEGDTWLLYVPSELAYGDSMRGEHIARERRLPPPFLTTVHLSLSHRSCLTSHSPAPVLCVRQRARCSSLSSS